MEIPFIIKKTIDSRRSTRSYKMLDIDQEVINSIRNFGEVIFLPSIPFKKKGKWAWICYFW
ncbi:hypothetical protein [Wukongibacter sp. M2B1]|uniref:hypothetical protein n=1 Tax=Wukongibacter sp. M2B1 TaxID=3088895 RepID=UPI003D798225